MGGYGSGPGGGRPSVDASLRLELPRLKRAGYLRPGYSVSGRWSWSYGGTPSGSVGLQCKVDPERESELVLSYSVNGEPVVQRIALVCVPMRFGGWRWYAICPFRNARCTTLVLPNGAKRFGSAKTWKLPYASQREDMFDRAHRRIRKAEDRLERLSRYARTKTKEKLWRRIGDAEEVLDYGTALLVGRLMTSDPEFAKRLMGEK
jgi:hypothetical protein